MEGEPITLKQLLGEYEQFLLEHGIVRSSLKTCDIRKLMEERFSVRVGFQDRYHRNQSTLVYNKEDGGTFLEAAINCWSVSDERLIAGNRLWEKVNSSAETMEWPPQTAAKLCNSREPHPLLHTFVKSLSGKGSEKTRSECLFLSDVLESHITGKKTPLKTLFAVTLYGSVRSKELSDLASDLGVAGTYKDAKYLNDTWTLNDLSQNRVCPPELAEGLPGTAFIDNDDWQTEDITGEL